MIFPNKFARIISDIFSPLLVPTYGMALSMWLTELRIVPERVRLIATLLIAMITGLVPLTAMITLRKTGKISNMDISNRTERFIPLVIATICYVCAALFLGIINAPLWLRLFFYGAALAAGLEVVINRFWKISAHATAMGGLTGLLLWFAVSNLADVGAMLLLTAGILLSGLTGSSRIALGQHGVGQIAAGYAMGLVCTFGLLIIFYF